MGTDQSIQPCEFAICLWYVVGWGVDFPLLTLLHLCTLPMCLHRTLPFAFLFYLSCTHVCGSGHLPSLPLSIGSLSKQSLSSGLLLGVDWALCWLVGSRPLNFHLLFTLPSSDTRTDSDSGDRTGGGDYASASAPSLLFQHVHLQSRNSGKKINRYYV